MALDLRVRLWPTQRRFFLSKARYPAFSGGFGSGKTYVGCFKAVVLAAENAPLPGLFVEPTGINLKDIALPMFRELLETIAEEPIPYKVTYPGGWPNITLWPGELGAQIWLRSGDKPETLQGITAAWAGVDEIGRINPKIWGSITSRVRHPDAAHMQVYVTGTPDAYWVEEKWAEKPEPGYEIFRGSTYENLAVDDEYIIGLKSSYSEEEQPRVIGGHYVHGGIGRVYKPFLRETHVREASPFDPANKERLAQGLPLCLACDFNIDPCVWLIGQHRQGVIYWADEIVLRDTCTADMIDALWERYPEWRGRVIVYGDPAGKARSTKSSRSDYEIMRQGGLRSFRVAKAAPMVKDRVLAMNAKLKAGDGEIRQFVHPDCVELIKDLEWVKWLTSGSGSALDKKDSDRTHASDAAGYMVMFEYPIRRPRRRGQRLSQYVKGTARAVSR